MLISTRRTSCSTSTYVIEVCSLYFYLSHFFIIQLEQRMSEGTEPGRHARFNFTDLIFSNEQLTDKMNYGHFYTTINLNSLQINADVTSFELSSLHGFPKWRPYPKQVQVILLLVLLLPSPLSLQSGRHSEPMQRRQGRQLPAQRISLGLLPFFRPLRNEGWYSRFHVCQRYWYSITTSADNEHRGSNILVIASSGR